jgi:hypothetical protein
MTDVDDQVEQATRFELDDVPDDKKQKFERLAKWNRADRDGDWMDRSQQALHDTLRLVDTFAGRLGLTDFQHERAKSYLKALDSSTRQGRRAELLAFVVCGVSGAQDGREYGPGPLHPDADETGSQRTRRTWQRLSGDLGLTYRGCSRAWHSVCNELGVDP